MDSPSPRKKTKQNSLDSQIEGLPVQRKPHTHREILILPSAEFSTTAKVYLVSPSTLAQIDCCPSWAATRLSWDNCLAQKTTAKLRGKVLSNKQRPSRYGSRFPPYFYFSRQASISRSTRLATSTPLNTERMGWSIDICFVVAVHQDFQSASGWRCSLGNSVHIRDDGNNKSNTRSRRWATSNECNLSTATVAATRWNGTPGISAAVVIQVDNSRAWVTWSPTVNIK